MGANRGYAIKKVYMAHMVGVSGRFNAKRIYSKGVDTDYATRIMQRMGMRLQRLGHRIWGLGRREEEVRK